MRRLLVTSLTLVTLLGLGLAPSVGDAGSVVRQSGVAVKRVQVSYGDGPVRQDRTDQPVRLTFHGRAGDLVALRALRSCPTFVLKHAGVPVLPGRTGYFNLVEPGRYAFVYTPCTKAGRRDSLQLVKLRTQRTTADLAVDLAPRRGFDVGYEVDAAAGAWLYPELTPRPGWTGTVSWHAFTGVTQDPTPFLVKQALHVPQQGPVLLVAQGHRLSPEPAARVSVRRFGLLPAIDATGEPQVTFSTDEPGRWLLAEMTLEQVTPRYLSVVDSTFDGPWQAVGISEAPNCSAAPPYVCDTDGAWIGQTDDGYVDASQPMIPYLGGPNPWVVIVMIGLRTTGSVTVDFVRGTPHSPLAP